MSRFKKLQEFEEHFDKLSVEELDRWKKYWTQHADGLQPKIRKQAMKRVYDIDKAIQKRSQDGSIDA